jgi:uncharacterized protein (TIGR00290 family)
VSRPRVLLSWSSGKDSAWTLHELRRSGDVEVVGLLTTLTATFDRVAMHGVRHELLRMQAAAVGLPLVVVPLPWPCPNDVYEAAMRAAITEAARDGVSHVAFGDLFLEDIRAYREARMADAGLKLLFPLWGRDTAALAREMVAGGQRATIVCVDPAQLDAAFAGRDFDDALLDELPETVDPCGERGELHTFAWDGPVFHHPVPVVRGEVVQRDGFVFADLLPVQSKRVPA